MTDPDATLAHVSDLVHAELAQYLPDDFVIDRGDLRIPGQAPTAKTISGTTVVLEDGHPKLDPHALNKFSMHMNSLCKERSLDWPTIVYANRSEIPA